MVGKNVGGNYIMADLPRPTSECQFCSAGSAPMHFADYLDIGSAKVMDRSNSLQDGFLINQWLNLSVC